MLMQSKGLMVNNNKTIQKNVIISASAFIFHISIIFFDIMSGQQTHYYIQFYSIMLHNLTYYNISHLMYLYASLLKIMFII